MAGIETKTLKAWQEKDAGFRAHITKAQADHALKNIGRIDKAAENDWRAAEKLLSTNPISKEDYAKEGNASGGISITLNIPRPGDLDEGKPIIDVTPD